MANSVKKKMKEYNGITNKNLTTKNIIKLYT